MLDLPCLAEGDLIHMGIKTMGSRKRILAAASEAAVEKSALADSKVAPAPLLAESRRAGNTITDFFLSKQKASTKHCITDFFDMAPGSKQSKVKAGGPAHGKENCMQQPTKPRCLPPPASKYLFLGLAIDILPCHSYKEMLFERS